MLSENIRFVALDFETTGLDINNDVPIQVGILEFNQEGNIIGGFQSLIRPEKKVKELKTIVGFITGLSLEKLESAPECGDIFDQLKPFFGSNTVIVGHNISFDLEFLKKFFPGLERKASIDTFRLAQSLVHYTPSYALEILVDSLRERQSFQDILKKVDPYFGKENNFHDAYYDSKVTIALFQYLIQRICLLIKNYPILEILLSQSEGACPSIFKKKSNLTILSSDLPQLKRISSPYTQILSGDYLISLKEKEHGKKYLVNNIKLKSLLSSLAVNKQTIFAFSNRSKLDIAKNILNDLGVKNLGFAKEEQTLNREKLESFISKGHFSEDEFYFILKYFSHAEQGLGVLELNTKGDYEIYTALKEQRETTNYPIVLATHGGLFSLLEQNEKYTDYNIVFFDIERRYKNYNFYLSRPYDLNYTLNYLDMLSYKFQLQYELEKNGVIKENWENFEEFKRFFIMFIGILGQETKAFFTNTDVTVQTLEPLVGNLSFYQTNKLLSRFNEEREILLRRILNPSEFSTIWKQVEHMQAIFQGVMIVEKKMRGRSDFYFVYSEDVKYTNRNDFLEEFNGHQTIFLTNNDETAPYLLDNEKSSGDHINKAEEKIFRLSKTASILEFIKNFNILENPNGCIFILSVKKEESVHLFEELITHGYEKSYLILVENITGGSGKNLFKAKQGGEKIIIGGYNFLLQLFAQKIAISQLIIYNNKGNQQDLIYSDILRYGQEALS